MGGAEMAGNAVDHNRLRVRPHDPKTRVASRSGEVHGEQRRANGQESVALAANGTAHYYIIHGPWDRQRRSAYIEKISM